MSKKTTQNTSDDPILSMVWRIIDQFKGVMQPRDFQNYILGLVFFKYLSEKMISYADGILLSESEIRSYVDLDEDNTSDNKLIKSISNGALKSFGYFIKPSETLPYLSIHINETNDLSTTLMRIFVDIEKSSTGTKAEESFKDIFSDLDLGSARFGETDTRRNEIIAQTILNLEKIRLLTDNEQENIPGDLFDYLIAKFAYSSGIRSGEFYTPSGVSEVLTRIAANSKKNIKNIYDPVCGSGSTLLQAMKHTTIDGRFFGQELNFSSFNLARMNMHMHNIHYSQFDIHHGDTLEDPQHLDHKFEAIVAQPPLGIHWSADRSFKDDVRFNGPHQLPPKSKADYAFILHMIHHLANEGTMAALIPQGALFRGGSESKIRQFLVKDKNYLDIVIQLPANLLPNTAISSSILVFKKNRKTSENVLFINATQNYEEHKLRRTLGSKDIEKIIDTIKNRKQIDGYSKLIKVDELVENNFNLNTPRYIPTDTPVIQKLLKRSGYPIVNILDDEEKWVDGQGLINGVESIKVVDDKVMSTSASTFYIPKIGNSPVITKLSDSKLKNIRNYIEIKFSEESQLSTEYVANFLNSETGILIRQSLYGEGVIPNLSISSLRDQGLHIPLPPPKEQQEIVKLQHQLDAVAEKAKVFQNKLWNFPVTHNSISEEAKDLIKEAPEDAWIEELPYPLASMLKRFYNEKDENRRYSLLLHFFEALSELITAIHLGAYVSNPALYSQFKSETEVGSKLESIVSSSNFGGWILFLNDSNKFIKRGLAVKDEDGTQKENILSAFGTTSEAYLQKLVDSTITIILEKTVAMRNKTKGHGPYVDVPQNIYESSLQLLEEIRKPLLDVFSNRSIIVYDSSEPISEAEIRYSVKVLRGSNPILPNDNVELPLSRILTKEFVYLYSEIEGSVIKISSIVKMGSLPDDKKIGFYFYNSKSKWKSYEFETEFEGDDAIIFEELNL